MQHMIEELRAMKDRYNKLPESIRNSDDGKMILSEIEKAERNIDTGSGLVAMDAMVNIRTYFAIEEMKASAFKNIDRR